jgi:hypothetical protein
MEWPNSDQIGGTSAGKDGPDRWRVDETRCFGSGRFLI